LTGKEGEAALEHVGITVNKNTVPFETRSPFITSGIRIGTPAVTTRGMKEKEMERIGNLIADVLAAPSTPPSRDASRPRSGTCAKRSLSTPRVSGVREG